LRYCGTCGSPVEIIRPPADDRERHVCRSCGAIHYVNPKIVVGAVCFHDRRLLLCRRAIEPRAGYWTIPAGYMETGETAEEGARREAWEEARARIAIDGLIAVYSVKRIDQVQLLYRAQLLDPAIAPGPESREVVLVAPDAIPWEELAFPTVRWVLERALSPGGAAAQLVTVGNANALPGRD
jgi:ADP-ribose pyrophosphatase YjhB (NUDIX family)